MMYFSVLASGSTGNSVYIEQDGEGYLIDAGLSAKRIVEQLAKINRSIDQVKGLLVTHEHSDHIKGVGVLARRHHIPVYANAKTWEAMSKSVGVIPTDLKFHFETEQTMQLGKLSFESFTVSHDAVDPMFYSVYGGQQQKLAVITDTGYVSDRMKGFIRDANSFVFESNHDVGMLQMCGYPWSTKRRILSDVGHVSNEDAAFAMKDVIGDKETNIYLSHLSRDNNMKDLARLTVGQVLEQFDVEVGKHVHLFDTDAEEPTTITKV